MVIDNDVKEFGREVGAYDALEYRNWIRLSCMESQKQAELEYVIVRLGGFIEDKVRTGMR